MLRVPTSDARCNKNWTRPPSCMSFGRYPATPNAVDRPHPQRHMLGQ